MTEQDTTTYSKAPKQSAVEVGERTLIQLANDVTAPPEVRLQAAMALYGITRTK